MNDGFDRRAAIEGSRVDRRPGTNCRRELLISARRLIPRRPSAPAFSQQRSAVGQVRRQVGAFGIAHARPPGDLVERAVAADANSALGMNDTDIDAWGCDLVSLQDLVFHI